MFNRILVPLDGSNVDEAILSQIEEQAARSDAEVILIKVLPATGVLPTTAYREYSEAKQYLDAVVQKLEARGIKASATMRYGKRAEEIVDYAETHKVDLVVMSTRGRRRVFGSVTEKVRRGTCLPILLVRAPVHGLVWLRDKERLVEMGRSVAVRQFNAAIAQ